MLPVVLSRRIEVIYTVLPTAEAVVDDVCSPGGFIPA